MTFEDFSAYCTEKAGVTIDYPFKGTSAWMKVAGKMFARANISEMKMGSEWVPPFHFINLKCDPDKAQELRALYPAIRPGWHQNKTHWNSIYLDGSLSDHFIEALIDDSYSLVRASLPKKLKLKLENE